MPKDHNLGDASGLGPSLKSITKESNKAYHCATVLLLLDFRMKVTSKGRSGLERCCVVFCVSGERALLIFLFNFLIYSPMNGHETMRRVWGNIESLVMFAYIIALPHVRIHSLSYRLLTKRNFTIFTKLQIVVPCFLCSNGIYAGYVTAILGSASS